MICITHLPQIAAMADRHYEIAKSADGGKTRTRIRRLDGEEMVTELARLLGGAQITEAVLENAREMKKLAEERRRGLRAAGTGDIEQREGDYRTFKARFFAKMQSSV